MQKTVSIEHLHNGRRFIFANDKNNTIWLCTYKQSIVGGEHDGKYLIKYEYKKRNIICEQYISRSARVYLK